jgi:hypothetical protein
MLQSGAEKILFGLLRFVRVPPAFAEGDEQNPESKKMARSVPRP